MKNPIPEAVWTQHVAILAKTGRGKTVVAKGGAAALMKARLRCGVVDPTAAWWGMRLKADGNTPGFPMVIFGGDHADIQIDRHLGGKIGALVASADWSWIVDISKMGVDDRTPFMTAFAESLFAENRRRLNLFLDECHLYMPQQKLPTKASAHMTAACNNLVSGGRSRGLNITMISQRSAKVHKDALTQAETLITLGMIAPHDIAAAEAWVKVQGDLKAAKVMLQSLPALPVGTGWIYAPELGLLEKVKFPMVDTFDSSRAPGVGEDLRAPTELGQINIEEIRAKLAPAPKQKLAAPAAPVPMHAKSLLPNQAKAVQRDLDAATHKGFLAGAEAMRALVLAYLEEAYPVAVSAACRTLTASQGAMLQKINTLKLPVQRFSAPVAALPSPVPTGSAPRPRPVPNPADAATVGGLDMPKGERVVLTAIAQHPMGCTRQQLTVLTGYKKTSRDTYLQKLAQQGLIEPGITGRIIVTGQGVDALGSGFEPLPTGAALRQHVLATLPQGERRVLEVAIEFYDGEVTRQEISERTEYQKTSRDTYIQKLAARELVEVSRHGIKASANLF